MRKLAFTLLILCLISNLKAQEVDCYYHDAGGHERDRNIDVIQMTLNVSFAPKEGKVMGRVEHQFSCLQSNVDTIFLDGPGIMVDSAYLDGKSIGFRKNDNGIICQTNIKSGYKTNHTLVLKYSALPKRGIYFIGWNLPEITDPVNMSRRQIWTQGQGIDNRHWIPMIDDRGDKFITEVFVNFDKEYNVLSNGALVDSKNVKNNEKQWHYKINNRHSGYLLMLAIDKYGIHKSYTANRTPIQFWYYPEHADKVEPTNRYSEKIIEFLESETGVNYPWGTYSQVMVQEFLYGAMENTSATVFGDFFNTDARGYLDRNYVIVNCHEATHQWFGDLITARNDGDHWLQESFATFYPGLFSGNLYGENEMHWYFRNNMNSALAAGLENSLPVRHSLGGTARHYPKGASVLYMLQNVMGKENFRRGIKYYLEKHGFSGVETHDLIKSFVDATGMNMDWFFDQWIYRGGEPNYSVSTQTIGDNYEFTIQQIHKQENTVKLFKMPFDFALYLSDGSVIRETQWIEKISEKVSLKIPEGKTVLFALFDEGSKVLKRATFNKTIDELKAQASKSKYVLDRYDAIVALDGKTFENKAAFLKSLYDSETNKQIRAEITKQLAGLGESDFIAVAYSDKAVEVRKAAIEHFAVDEKTVKTFEKALEDSSYALIENALTKLWESDINLSPRNSYLEKIKDLRGANQSLRIKFLEYAAESYEGTEQMYIGQLAAMAGEMYEFRTRVNAMNALKRIGACNEIVVKNLYACLLNFNPRLQNPAKDVLNYFKQQSSNARIMRKVLNSAAYSAEERTKIKGLLGMK